MCHDFGRNSLNSNHSPYHPLHPLTPYPLMSRNDSYAILEASRRKKYEAAYESEEAKAWRQSLSPAELERAEALGLLRAVHEADASSHSIETLSRKMQPQETMESEFDDHLIAAPLRKRQSKAKAEILATLGMDDVEELKAFINQDNNPRLRSACLSYLLNESNGTCEDYAKMLGMSKQAFHYHVRQIEKQLGLPPMGNQKNQKSREAYRTGNRRR